MSKLTSQKTPFYYGWYIVLVLAINTTVGYGILYYAFSVFITPMEIEFGWSRGQLTLGLALSSLVSGIIAYPIGWWVDKYGARALMSVGAILASLFVILWAQVETLWQFYIVWCGIGISGAMLLYEPAFAVIATWFTVKRSTALTIVTFAAGFASTIFLPLSDQLLIHFGWRDAVELLGIMLGVITAPLSLLIIRRRPEDIGLSSDGIEKSKMLPIEEKTSSISFAFRSRFFWFLTLSFSIAGFATAALRVHLIPILMDMEIPSTTAAFASGSIGIFQVVGRLIFMPLDKFMSGRIMLAGLFLMQGLAIMMLFNNGVIWSLIIFVILFGASVGMRTLVRPSILADTYGSANYGRISSLMALPLTLSATIAPVIAGFIYDYFQSYTLLITITLSLSVIASMVVLFNHVDFKRNLV